MDRQEWKRERRKLLPLVVGILLLAGCATIRPEPFSEFSTSVQELRQGADELFTINDDLNRERFIDDVAADSTRPDGEETIINLLIETVEGKPFEWRMERTPLFMMSRRFRNGMYALNSALVTYSELLGSLASPGLVSREQFDAVAEDLDANLKSAADTLGIRETDQELSLFSAAASTAAHAYIENRRRKALHKTLEKNQKNIEALAAKLQEAVRLAARNLWQDYQEQSVSLARQLTPGAGGIMSARRKHVESLIALDEFFVTHLSALDALHRSYGILPEAHKELINATERPETSLSSIRELKKNGKHLQKLYKGLVASEAPGN